MRLKSDIQRECQSERAAFGGMFRRGNICEPSLSVSSGSANGSNPESMSVKQAGEYLRDAECAAIRLVLYDQSHSCFSKLFELVCMRVDLDSKMLER